MLIWAQKETNNPNKHKVFENPNLWEQTSWPFIQHSQGVEPGTTKSSALTTWLCHLHGFRI